MSTKTIVTEFESRHQFLDFLKSNPGHIVVKFGADWCGPCKKIHDEVEDFSPNVLRMLFVVTLILMQF